MAKTIKSLPAIWDTQVQSGLVRAPEEGKGYPLQYSCWRIPWTKEPGGLQFLGCKESERLSGYTFTFKDSESDLYDATMMDVRHYPFVQTHRIYDTKSEPQCEPWALNEDAASVRLHQTCRSCLKRAALVGDVENGGG